MKNTTETAQRVRRFVVRRQPDLPRQQTTQLLTYVNVRLRIF